MSGKERPIGSGNSEAKVTPERVGDLKALGFSQAEMAGPFENLQAELMVNQALAGRGDKEAAKKVKALSRRIAKLKRGGAYKKMVQERKGKMVKIVGGKPGENP